jgi:hypothetical protein
MPSCACAERLAALEAELATLRELVVGAAALRELAALLEQAGTAFGARRWTTSHLVDLGIVGADDARRVGRLLARMPCVEAGGRRLVPAGTVAHGRAWVVEVARDSLPPDARGT